MSSELDSLNSTGITLTSGDGAEYMSPFTITPNGAILTVPGVVAVYSSLTNPVLLNEGLINAGGNGVEFISGGIVENIGTSAASTGYDYGVWTPGFSAGTVLNDGTITAIHRVGVELYAGDVTNSGTSSMITGRYTGVGIEFDGTILNEGTIYGTMFQGAILTHGGSITNRGTASVISGNSYGVYIDDAGTVDNSGTIAARGASGVGVYNLEGGYDINRGTSSTISGDSGIIVNGSAGTVVNDGTITGTGAGGIGVGVVNGGGTVTNAGTLSVISAGGYGVKIGLEGGTVSNEGTISGSLGGVALTSGFVFNIGKASEISSNAIGVDLGGGTVLNSGTISGGQAAVMFGGPGNNRLIVNPGAVFNGVVEASGEGSNAIELAPGAAGEIGTLNGVGSQYTGFGTIAFDAGASWSVSGDIADLAAGQTITGFGPQDSIALTGIPFIGTGGSFGTAGEDTYTVATSGTLTIDADGTDYNLLLPGATVGQNNFVLSGDDLVLTEQAICHLRGTRVLTPTGEVLVEDLRIGDHVVTRFSGIQSIKWIGRQNFQRLRAGRDHVPVRLRPRALGDRLPARDLYVSPGHSMLLGDRLVLARSLVNGITITQDECPAQIEYFQLDLGRHDCVIAEGTWSETFADGPGLREMFHNAADYDALYPDEHPPETLSLCAPRPERGQALEAVLRPVVARAAAGQPQGRLRGYVDLVTGPWKLEGWAQDLDNPELPVLLEILAEGNVIGTVLACDFREDLLRAGIGQGRCSFVFNSPVSLRPALWPKLQVRRAADAVPLPVTDAMRRSAQDLSLVA